MYKTTYGEPNVPKIVFHAVVGFVALMFFLTMFGTVDAGTRGVKTRLGNVVGTIEPGFYVKMPFPIEKVHTLTVKTNSVLYEREEPLEAASGDLQEVKVATVVNYHLNPSEVAAIYVQYGSAESLEGQVIRPAVRDTIKAIASKYTAEQLVTKRPEFTQEAYTLLSSRLSDKGVTIEQVNITNFDFSPAFAKAIEEKVTAEQNALASKNKLEQTKYEAEQRIAQAKGEAEAIRIQSQAINSQGGEDYVNLKAIEKWNGVLPTQFVPGSAVPFINLPR